LIICSKSFAGHPWNLKKQFAASMEFVKEGFAGHP
jgi:hypothetical protein